MVKIIKIISAYCLGLFYMISVSGFIGIFFIGFFLNEILNINTIWLWILGIIITILIFIGMGELFVWEMIRGLCDEEDFEL